VIALAITSEAIHNQVFLGKWGDHVHKVKKEVGVDMKTCCPVPDVHQVQLCHLQKPRGWTVQGLAYLLIVKWNRGTLRSQAVNTEEKQNPTPSCSTTNILVYAILDVDLALIYLNHDEPLLFSLALTNNLLFMLFGQKTLQHSLYLPAMASDTSAR